MFAWIRTITGFAFSTAIDYYFRGFIKIKTILKERTIKFSFEKPQDRRFYLERMCAQVNNDLLNPDLKPMDRSRYFNILIAGVKLIHEMDRDSSLEDLEARLAELEAQYKKAQDFSNNRR